MSQEHVSSAVFEFDETLATAKALAEREIEHTDVLNLIMTDIFGDQFPPLTDLQRVDLGLTNTVKYFKLLAGEVQAAGPQESARLMLAEGGMFNTLIDNFCQSEPTIDQEQLRATATLTIERMDDYQAVQNSAEDDMFSQQMKAINQLAQEHGVSAADVINSDRLRKKVITRTQTIDQLAAHFIGILEGMTAEKVGSSVQEFIDAAATVTGDEKLRLSMEVQLDPQVQAYLQTLTEASREVVRQQFAYQLLDSWGFASVEHLSPEQKAILQPQFKLSRAFGRISFNPGN